MLTWLRRKKQLSRSGTGPASPSSSSGIHQGEAKPIKITCQARISSVVFLPDGKHFISSDKGGGVRRWRVENGQEVGAPMNAGSGVNNVAMSSDGKWLVGGADDGFLRVWNAQTHEKVTEFKAHLGELGRVYAVDISPDGTRLASGANDNTARLWSLSTGERLLGPLRHDQSVVAVKFSPDGRLIATATWNSVRIYDAQAGRLLFNTPIKINSHHNQSVAWTYDSRHLFALSLDSQIHCLDASSGKTLVTWRIPGPTDSKFTALATNGRLVAASSDSSLSFWDATTHEQIGSVIEHGHSIRFVAISAKNDLVFGVVQKITIRGLGDILASRHTEDFLSKEQQGLPVGTETDRNTTCPEVKHRRYGSELVTSQDELPTKQKYDDLDQTINSLRADLGELAGRTDSKVECFLKTLHDLRRDLATLPTVVDQKENNPDKIVESLERIAQQIRTQLAESQKKVEERDNLIQIRQLHALLAEVQRCDEERDSAVQILRAHERKHLCEALHAAGRTVDTASSLADIRNATSKDERANKLFAEWITEFTSRCTSALEKRGDDASNAEKHDEALKAYSTVLSLFPSAANNMLFKWASVMLRRKSPNEAFEAGIRFGLPKFLVYKTICDLLERDGYVRDAIAFFKLMEGELAAETSDECSQWQLGFQQRCAQNLENLAEVEIEARHYKTAAEYLTTALLLNGVDRPNIFIQRSKARAMMASWKGALNDANEAIKLDPSSHQGYERRHAVFLGASRNGEAVAAFDVMLSKIDQSPNEDIRKLRSQYTDARPTIRRIIRRTVHSLPSILINTATGRLYDKNQQAALFETLPIWNELVASMTKKLDHERIGTAVKEFYRYVMLSHTWQQDEPLLQKVKNASVYDLETSTTNVKLKEFCSIVHLLGFHWAWADTTCIDQKDNVVLQESLVAMFTWYRGSSLTLIYLCDVSSESQLPDGLRRSKWNTRGWTYQEYVAAETVKFYTRDWKPYLGLELENHKESPNVISEMQQATGMSAEEMSILKPGLDKVREKLFVASSRHTTRTEDIAYSLLGIFNIAIPVIYGEGDRAVGRLLEHVLTGSGDVSILAWTGQAGSYNSCLPVDLTVYHELVPPHIPQSIDTIEMDSVVTALQSSLHDSSDAVKLYDALKALPAPFLASSRLSVAGIICPVTELACTSPRNPSTGVAIYHATTSLFGDIEIKTSDDLTGMEDLSLIHLWIRPILQQLSSRRGDAPDVTTQALRLLVRLRQPFGGLLLEQLSMDEYRRVAADGLIVARVSEDVPLAELVAGADKIDIQ